MKRASVLLLSLVATVASAQSYDEAGLKAFRAERENSLKARAVDVASDGP